MSNARVLYFHGPALLRDGLNHENEKLFNNIHIIYGVVV